MLLYKAIRFLNQIEDKSSGLLLELETSKVRPHELQEVRISNSSLSNLQCWRP